MRYLIALPLIASLSACGVLSDGILVVATPEALRAYSDSQAALIAQSRTMDEHGDTAYWQQRRLTETEHTSRWAKFFGGK